MTLPFTSHLIVEGYLSGVRIDSFLVRHFRNYTRYRMQRMIRAGAARVDGATVELQQRVFRGQAVEIRLFEPPDKLLEAEHIPLKIVYEDPWLLVIDKPAGLIVHPVGDFSGGTLANALQWHLDQLTHRRGLLRPGIVHRLDRMTSGLMVVTTDHVAHRRLSIDFQRKGVSKSYYALVDGRICDNCGSLRMPVGRAAASGTVLMSAASSARNARPARTDFQVLERFEDATLVLATPFTGRNHQIRVHFSAIGHPVLGDEFYGAFGRIRNGSGVAAGRHALHARHLGFAHPLTDEWMEFESPLPDDIVALARPSAPRRAGLAVSAGDDRRTPRPGVTERTLQQPIDTPEFVAPVVRESNDRADPQNM